MERLVGILDVDNVQQTGALFPRCVNLRKRGNKKFLFLRSFNGRVFTERLRLSVCKLLLLKLDVAREPGMDLHEVAKAQAVRLKRLAKRSKRISMREQETQPYVPGLNCSATMPQCEIATNNVNLLCEILFGAGSRLAGRML